MVEIEVGVSEVDKNDDQWGFNHEKVVFLHETRAFNHEECTMKNWDFTTFDS